MKRPISIILILLLVTQIVVVLIFLIKINKDIQNYKNLLGSEIRTTIEKVNRSNYTFENDSIYNYQLTKTQLAEIKDHINFLSQEVDKACINTQNTLEADIDRLNTFMAIGIGFLALFGIFAPFLVNLIFKSEIEKDIEDYKKQSKEAINDSKEAKKIADKISPIIKPTQELIKEFPPLKENFEKFSKELREKSPQVTLLILQNQISRLYNITKIDEAVRKNRKDYFAGIFQNILNSFIEYNNNNSEPTESFKHTIGDFHDNLKSNKIRYYIFNRDQQEFVDAFCNSLISLFTPNQQSFHEKMGLVIINIQPLIDGLNN